MMIPQMEQLYKPYSKDASLEKTMEWFLKQAQANGIPDAVRDTVITEVFLEMAKGKTFPTDHCDCGCEFPVKWSCVAMNHYTLKKMLERKQQAAEAYNKVLQNALTTSILDHVHRENEKYVAEQELKELAAKAESGAVAEKKKSGLTDWGKSPIVRAARWLWTGSR